MTRSMNRRPLLLLALLPALSLATLARAQQISSRDNPFDRSGLPASASDETAPGTQRLVFRLQHETALPGPLPGAGPALVGDEVQIAVSGGQAFIALEGATTARIDSTAEPGNVTLPEWHTDAEGQIRVQERDGLLFAEKKCGRCRRGWKKIWKLRTPGIATATPLVDAKRVYFGAVDNRVYAVKRRNGHRVWSADVGRRVTRPLVFWDHPPRDVPGEGGKQTPAATADEGNGHAPVESLPPPDVRAILVVPDGGTRLLALSPADGQKLASTELSDDAGKWVSVPLTVPDGRVILARQKYLVDEATLMVYRLTPP